MTKFVDTWAHLYKDLTESSAGLQNFDGRAGLRDRQAAAASLPNGNKVGGGKGGEKWPIKGRFSGKVFAQNCQRKITYCIEK
ncbi:MAG: hypothetical protein AAGN35_25485 [Bacteroidota bacterium]